MYYPNEKKVRDVDISLRMEFPSDICTKAVMSTSRLEDKIDYVFENMLKNGPKRKGNTSNSIHNQKLKDIF